MGCEGTLDDGHADGDAVAHLFEDGGLGAVSDAGGELETANDGAGVHDDGGGRERGEALAGELVGGLIGFEVELESGEALGLDAEHHDDLRLAQGGLEVALDGDAGASGGCDLREEFPGAAEDDLGAETREKEHVGASDAAVEDVANDGDGDAAEGVSGDGGEAGKQVLEDGTEVEQGLGGMLVHAVAGVEHGQAGELLENPGCAGGFMAKDDGLGAKGVQGEAGILEGLAFLDAGGEAGDEGGIRTERLGGQLEAGAGARGGLVEEQGHAALGEDARTLDGVHGLKGGGAGEEMADGVEGEILYRKQRARIVGKR